jgi:uncharacterized protein YcbX
LERSTVGRLFPIPGTVKLCESPSKAGGLPIRVTSSCYRCVMTTLPQGELSHDPQILRTIVHQNQANAGVYAAVLQGGTLRRGDPVRCE